MPARVNVSSIPSQKVLKIPWSRKRWHSFDVHGPCTLQLTSNSDSEMVTKKLNCDKERQERAKVCIPLATSSTSTRTTTSTRKGKSVDTLGDVQYQLEQLGSRAHIFPDMGCLTSYSKLLKMMYTKCVWESKYLRTFIKDGRVNFLARFLG